MEQEQLHVMLTDNKQGMIRDVLISKGTRQRLHRIAERNFD